MSAAAMALVTTLTVSGCGKEAVNLPPVIGQMPGMMPTVPNNTGGYQGGLPSAIDHGPAGPARLVMKNVNYRISPKLVAEVPAMDAIKVPNTPGAPIVMDDPTSFTIMIQNGAFALDEENIASLMNNVVFNYPDAPLKEQTVTLTPGRLGIKGKMHLMGMWVSFEMEGTPRVLPNGKIELQADKINAMGLPQKGIMNLVGLKMESLIKVREGRGLEIVGNSILMDCTKMLPPPAVQGRVTQCTIEQDPRDGKMKKFIIFGNGPQAVRDERLPAPNAPNYIHIWGGVVRFVNTYNTFTNLQIVDADPSDPFDFYMNEYGIQMVQGVIVLSPMGWTQSIQPDYHDRNIPVRPNVPSVILPASDQQGIGGGATGGYPGYNPGMGSAYPGGYASRTDGVSAQSRPRR